LNFGEMKARVALTLDNMPSSDPWYSAIGAFINRCGNAFLRMKANVAPWDLNPEMDQTWTLGPTYPIDGTTIINANTIARPSDCLMVRTIHRAESATLPDWTANPSAPPVTFVEREEFDILSKDASTAGYIRIFTRQGKAIKVWPSITAAYPDYLHIFGPAVESPLVDDSDSFFMVEHWHELVCVLSARDMAARMGLYTIRSQLDTQLQQELGQTADVEALSDGQHIIEIHGMPTSGSVYPGLE
jgi:hypothetical protein